jgi:hypothetical protein
MTGSLAVGSIALLAIGLHSTLKHFRSPLIKAFSGCLRND